MGVPRVSSLAGMAVFEALGTGLTGSLNGSDDTRVRVLHSCLHIMAVFCENCVTCVTRHMTSQCHAMWQERHMVPGCLPATDICHKQENNSYATMQFFHIRTYMQRQTFLKLFVSVSVSSINVYLHILHLSLNQKQMLTLRGS